MALEVLHMCIQASSSGTHFAVSNLHDGSVYSGTHSQTIERPQIFVAIVLLLVCILRKLPYGMGDTMLLPSGLVKLYPFTHIHTCKHTPHTHARVAKSASGPYELGFQCCSVLECCTTARILSCPPTQFSANEDMETGRMHSSLRVSIIQ
jgi:hypothetical protein